MFGAEFSAVDGVCVCVLVDHLLAGEAFITKSRGRRSLVLLLPHQHRMHILYPILQSIEHIVQLNLLLRRGSRPALKERLGRVLQHFCGLVFVDFFNCFGLVDLAGNDSPVLRFVGVLASGEVGFEVLGGRVGSEGFQDHF